jgi:hypothetical protein
LLQVELERKKSQIERLAAQRDRVQCAIAFREVQLLSAQSVIMQRCIITEVVTGNRQTQGGRKRVQAQAKADAAEVAKRECIIWADPDISKGSNAARQNVSFAMSATEAMDMLL